jgi:integration host factor subunit alpha
MKGGPTMPLSGTLTKARIVEAVVETNGYTHKKAFEAVEIMLQLIKRSLDTVEDVLISGFEKFCVKKRQRVRNPATGENMNKKCSIPALSFFFAVTTNKEEI